MYVDGQRIITTEDHPFWNETDQRWQDADALDVGDYVRTPTGVARVTRFNTAAYQYAPAYNLTVKDIHTYYVIAGNTPVLVHNDGCGRSVAKYEDITDPNSRIANRLTDVGHEEFGDTLISNGWSRSVSKDGSVQIFQKDGAKYALRGNANTYDGWTAEFTPDGSKKATLKIRLGG